MTEKFDHGNWLDQYPPRDIPRQSVMQYKGSKKGLSRDCRGN